MPRTCTKDEQGTSDLAIGHAEKNVCARMKVCETRKRCASAYTGKHVLRDMTDEPLQSFLLLSLCFVRPSASPMILKL
jgi:hypothetical protein